MPAENAAPEPKTIAAATDQNDFNAVWKIAEAKAQAHEEAGGGKEPREPKAKVEKKEAPKVKDKSLKDAKTEKLEKSEKVVKAKEAEKKAAEEESEEEDSEEEAVEEAPAKKSEAKGKKAEAKSEEEDAEDEEEEAPAKKPAKKEAKAEEDEGEEEEREEPEEDDEPDLAKLEKLAKKLGLKLENGAVTVEERAGFRAEKRKWRERRDAEEADFSNRISAANRRFNPLLAAEKAFAEGDYDTGLIAMGVKGGLSEANEKTIERASGQDPRVTKLERELAQERAERQERERQAQEAHRTAEQERADRDALVEIGEELSSHSTYGRLAKNEWFLNGVLKLIKDNWDGYETLTAEQAAAEHLQLLRKNNRAKMAYDAMRLVFEPSSPRDRAAKTTREAPQESDEEEVDRSNETSARPGKKPVKNLPRRKAAEAGARREFASEQEWSKWAASLMAGSSG